MLRVKLHTSVNNPEESKRRDTNCWNVIYEFHFGWSMIVKGSVYVAESAVSEAVVQSK
jgi:hypothetical protein